MSVRIIAEAAMGYEGKEALALQLVRGAAAAQADVVKFQCVFPEDLVPQGHARWDFYARMVMSLDSWRNIAALARELDVRLALDVFGDRSMSIAAELKPFALKLHASDFFNRPLFESARQLAELVFLSASGIAFDEIGGRLAELDEVIQSGRMVVSTGFQAVPTPLGLAGLGRITRLRALSPQPAICFMDHTAGHSSDGTALSAMAVALGSDWLERHLTLDRALELIDWTSALTPSELKEYVAAIHRLTSACAGADFVLGPEEQAYRAKSVKKVLTRKTLSAGHVIAESDLTLLRADGAEDVILDPRQAVGRTLRGNVSALTPLRAANLA